MLSHLYIKNFALIDELDIDFHTGFSVITGETGAGKSIVLGALGLLLGRRAESKQVKTGEKRCTIEAHFSANTLPESLFTSNDIDYDPDDTILRREVTAQGKSRAFINDSPVSLQLLRTIGNQLIDIHSQHQNLLIERSDFQLQVLDIISKDAAQLSDYQSAYKEYHAAGQELSELQQSLNRSRTEEDFMRFQLQELTNAKLVDGELEQLEQEANTLEHAEDIKSALYEADTQLNAENRGATDSVRRATQSLQHIATVYPQVAEAANRLESVSIELQDIAADISASVESVDFDPQRLDSVNERLDLINTLLQKYRAESIAELLQLQTTITQKLNQIDNSDEAITELQQRMEQLLSIATDKAARLTQTRIEAAHTVERQMLDRLVPLGLPNVRFEVKVTPQPLSLTGADSVQFLFSANTSTPLQPVADVASGGEIARVMLSLKALLSGASGLSTIIFDEIDTGVSGKIAQKMAQIMADMADRGQQVISITHLPQIAAAGQHHYKVEKSETVNGTESHMRELSSEQRIDEIAQMLSGADISDAARQNACELLQTAATR